MRTPSSIQNLKSKIQNRIFLALLLLAVLPLGCSRAPAGPWKSDSQFIQIHRCGRFYGPTETVPTLQAAVRAGADSLDVDLRMTRDGTLVCFHDGLLITREAFGPVELLDRADVSRANVGWEFDPSFVPARPVTFEEFLRWCSENRLQFHFETKDDNIGAAAIALVDRFGAMPLCTGMDGFKAPKRDDYKPVTIGMHTMDTGADVDRRALRRAVFRHEGARLRINIDDCRMLADVLDRRGELRTPGPFTLTGLLARRSWPTPVPLDAFPAGSADAVRTINDIATGHATMLPGKIIAAAKDGSPTARAACLWELGRRKHSAAHDLIAEAAARNPAGDNELIVARAATWALSEFDRPEDVALLREVVMAGVAAGDPKKSGTKGWHAEFAAEALGRMTAPASIDALVEALRTKPANPFLTQCLAAALARHYTAAIPGLVSALGDERLVNARETVEALLRLQPDSIPAVEREFAGSKDPVVRRNCLRVLGLAAQVRLDAKPLLDAMSSDDADLRLLAVWVAGKHRVKGTKERVQELLKDPDDGVRGEAEQAAGRY